VTTRSAPLPLSVTVTVTVTRPACGLRLASLRASAGARAACQCTLHTERTGSLCPRATIRVRVRVLKTRGYLESNLHLLVRCMDSERGDRHGDSACAKVQLQVQLPSPSH
jgi:hypothetical protein